MLARTRDILATNYIEQLGVPPSADYREIRRRLQRAEIEAQVGAATLDRDELDRAKRALSTERHALEYRVLARWGGDARLAPWAPTHDAALDRLRRAAEPGAAVKAAETWLKAHRDPGLFEALGTTEGERLEVRWVGDVVEDFLSGFLVPGAPSPPAASLTRLDLDHFPEVRNSLWLKLIACRKADVEAVAGTMPDLDSTQVRRVELKDLVAWRDSVQRLAEEVRTIQSSMAKMERRTSEHLPAQLIEASEDLGNATMGVAEILAILMARASAFRAGLEVLAGVEELRCAHTIRIRLRRLSEVLEYRSVAERRRDRSDELEKVPRASKSSPRPRSAQPSRVNRGPAQPAARQVGPDSDEYGFGSRDSLAAALATYPIIAFGGRPFLFTYMGTGSRLTMSHEHVGPLHAAVLALTLFWIPFIPLRRYVVEDLGHRTYRVYGRLPLRKRDIIHQLVGVVLLVSGVIGLALAGRYDNVSNETAVGSTPSETALRTTPSSQQGGEIRTGSCVVYSEVTQTLRQVSCSSPGAARVLGTFKLTGVSYPSESEIGRQASLRCPAASESYVYPALSGWILGDRQVVCLDR